MASWEVEWAGHQTGYYLEMVMVLAWREVLEAIEPQLWPSLPSFSSWLPPSLYHAAQA